MGAFNRKRKWKKNVYHQNGSTKQGHFLHTSDGERKENLKSSPYRTTSIYPHGKKPKKEREIWLGREGEMARRTLRGGRRVREVGHCAAKERAEGFATSAGQGGQMEARRKECDYAEGHTEGLPRSET